MKPINRGNKEDLFKQIGRVEVEIRELDKRRSKFDKELDSLPKKRIYLNYQKEKIALQVSKKKLYLNQLENDIKNL